MLFVNSALNYVTKYTGYYQLQLEVIFRISFNMKHADAREDENAPTLSFCAS
jgi:hypothetical protein